MPDRSTSLIYASRMEPEQYPRMYLYRRIVQAKLFIDEHYAESIDLENIADEAYFSKFHFIRLFKKIYGRTPHQYLVKVRLEKAMDFLSSGVSVSETCLAVGFESPGSFATLFRRVNGLSPSTYLSQQLLRKQQIREEPLRFVPGCFAHQHGWMEKKQF